MAVKKSILSNLNLIADFSYAWVLIHDYLELLQSTVTNKPKAVLMLKTVFLKLSTIMERPLLRILQANSPDFDSVAKFYSEIGRAHV